jgi:argininosuccinate synthase
LKSRGGYETPGGTITLASHRAIESITFDRQVQAQTGIAANAKSARSLAAAKNKA